MNITRNNYKNRINHFVLKAGRGAATGIVLFALSLFFPDAVQTPVYAQEPDIVYNTDTVINADDYYNALQIGFESGDNRKVTVESGTINVTNESGGAYGSINLGVNGTTGLLTINGGSLSIDGRILMAANGDSGQATIDVNGGELNLGVADHYTTSGSPGCGVMWWGQWKSTVNLNDGVMSFFGMSANEKKDDRLFNFNGGELKFVSTTNPLNTDMGVQYLVGSGGAVINTNGFDVSFGTSLATGVTEAGSADGGLTKTGAGTLTLTAPQTFTGNVTVSGGTLNIAGSANLGVIGEGKTVTVESGAQMIFSHHDTFGGADVNPTIPINVNGGTLASNNTFTTFGPLNLNGGTLIDNGGANGTYRAFQLKGNVTVGGNVASIIKEGETGTNHGVQLSANGSTTFNVADVTNDSNADLIISASLYDGPNTVGRNLVKTGAGTMELSGTSYFTGATNVQGGTVVITGSVVSNLYANGGDVIIDSEGKTQALRADAYSYAVKIGTDGKTGSLTVNAGTVNVKVPSSTSTAGSINLGVANGNGQLTINGGSLNVDGRILMAANGDSGQATIDVNGGELNLGVAGKYTTGGDPGCGVMWWGQGKTTVNLNGGVMSFFGMNKNTKVGDRIFNFNGGELKLVSANNPLNTGLGVQYLVGAGGAVINTNGFDVSFGTSLATGVTEADSTDGGLTKTGAGTLTLTTEQKFTGNVTVSGGTLNIADSANLGVIGEGKTATVESGAQMTFSRNDTFGQAGANPTITINVNGGTLASNNTFTTFGPLNLNGGTLLDNGGANNEFRTFLLKGDVTVGGDSASMIKESGAGAVRGIHLSSNEANAFTTTFNVADATGDSNADLIISSTLYNGPRIPTGSILVKTGVGTMSLEAANAFTGGLVINEGTIIATGGVTSLGNGNLTLAPGASLEIIGGTSGAIALAGTANLAGTIDLSNYLTDWTKTSGYTVLTTAGITDSGLAVTGLGPHWEWATENNNLVLKYSTTDFIWNSESGTFLTNTNWENTQTPDATSKVYIEKASQIATVDEDAQVASVWLDNAANLVINPDVTLTAESMTNATDDTLDLNAGNLTLTNAPAFGITNTNSDNDSTLTLSEGELSGSLAGNTNLTKVGTGELTLSAVNDHTGVTTVSEGTLNLTAENAIAGSSAVVNNATINATANQEIHDLSGTESDGYLSMGDMELEMVSDVDSLYAGRISSTGTVTKSGSGTFTMNYASTGIEDPALAAETFIIDAGRANINGLVANTLRIGTGAEFSPGEEVGVSYINALDVMREGDEFGKLIFEYLGEEGAGGWDQLSFFGTDTQLTLNDGVIFLEGDWDTTKEYLLVTDIDLSENGDMTNYLSTPAQVNWFLQGTAEGALLVGRATGPEVPEPSTVVLLLLGATGLFVCRRRRK